MIYLNNITGSQRLMIPANGNTGNSDTPVLRIRNTVDHTVHELPAVRNQGASSMYVSVMVSLPSGLADGSYEYRLCEDGGIISEGCLQIGDYQTTDTEYGKRVEYRQYEA